MKPLDIPVLNKSNSQKVLEYVQSCPRCTSRDIVADLDMKPQTVRITLTRLQRKGFIRTHGRDDASGLMFWFMSEDGTIIIFERPQAQIKQETVTSWPACKVEQQNPWSALGL